MKHILFLSYDGMTDPLGQSQVIPYLAGLTKFGYRFTILSCDKKDKFLHQEKYVREMLDPFPIQWHSIPYHKNPPVLSSIYDYRQMKKKAVALHRNDAFDMVHTRPGVPTLVAAWLKKNLSIKFLNDVRGFWADERVDGGIWNRKNIFYNTIYRFFKKHEYECLEIADYNNCLTQAAKQEMLSWTHIKNQPLKLEVIPCSVDVELFDPEKITPELQTSLRKSLGIRETDLVFTYLGSIGGWYLTREMMEFCRVLQNKIPTARFLFITPHHHKVIKSAAAAAGINNENIIIRSALRHEVPALLSLSSYAFFFIKPCYSKLSSSPTKHGEIMAMGIPVITNEGVGDVAAIVEKYDSGFIINAFSTEAYNNIANNIVEEKKFDAAAIRNAALAYYALPGAILKYRDVYHEILGD